MTAGPALARDHMAGYNCVYRAVDDETSSFPEVRYPGRVSRIPTADENPLGAWFVTTQIRRAQHGKLAGRSVAIKDNVFVAEVPLMNGVSMLEGYTPPFDATIVTRILDAGGNIVGKSVCEAYCLSAASHTSQSGVVHNPHRVGYSAGGSSSGSGALVAAGAVDMAIGCDQGGSVRIPASLCGICGMKPTTGLVPYTGILGFDPILDHAGPMTASVEDNALLLEVLAGADGRDPRQIDVQVGDYRAGLGQSVAGLKIGVVAEGFGTAESEDDVDAKVRAAAGRFRELGAQVSEISIPMHSLGGAIMFATLQSTANAVFEMDGFGGGREDVLEPGFYAYQGQWRQRINELPEHMKAFFMIIGHLQRECGHRLYANAINLLPRLRSAYDQALAEVDLLLMPTTPMKAQPHPPAGAPPHVVVGAAWSNFGNTSPFDVSHHPAMSIPCAMSDGLPVGLMLVGAHWDEATIYRAAHAFEQSGDWREM